MRNIVIRYVYTDILKDLYWYILRQLIAHLLLCVSTNMFLQRRERNM